MCGRRGGLLRLEAGVVGVVVVVVVTADVPIVGVLSDASIRVWQVVVQDVGRLVIGRTGLVGLEDAFDVLFVCNDCQHRTWSLQRSLHKGEPVVRTVTLSDCALVRTFRGHDAALQLSS